MRNCQITMSLHCNYDQITMNRYSVAKFGNLHQVMVDAGAYRNCELRFAHLITTNGNAIMSVLHSAQWHDSK